MVRGIRLAACALILLTASAQAQEARAPWFDSDGFYNKAGVDLERANSDLTVCRAEAARLRTLRDRRTPSASAAHGFNPDGTYNPVIAGAAAGIFNIMTALQDQSYNGSIEQIEFRDCTVALGYRHYRLSEQDQTAFDTQPDRGFAALVAASPPSSGALNTGEIERNYFQANLAERPFQNPAPQSTLTAAADDPPAGANMLARLAPGQIATPQPGMATIVASARQLAGSLDGRIVGDTFRFQRVTQDGRFVDLLAPAPSFALLSHFDRARRSDPTLAGELDAPRYSTYQIPAGRYALSTVGLVNACLGTLTFEIRDGEVAYLGDYVVRAARLPIAPVFNPFASMRSGIENRMRSDVRFSIGDDLEAARQALQADSESKARLERVAYQNDFRIPCEGTFIGRAANPNWPSFGAAQATAFHDAFAASVTAAR